MAYSTASAPASCVAIVSALSTWATSNGWTVDRAAASATGFATWLAIHKGSCYLNFAVPTGDGMLSVYGATGYSGGAGPSAQPNVSAAYTINPGQLASGTVNPGPYTAYHFFSAGGGTYLHILIEVSAGVFAQLHAGALNAIGGASPAIYLTAGQWSRFTTSSGSDAVPSSPDAVGNAKPFCADVQAGPIANTALGCTVDGTFRWFIPTGGASPARLLNSGYSAYSSPNGLQRSFISRAPNAFNGIPPLGPIPFWAERAVGNVYSLIGEAPDVRFVDMSNNNAKDEIAIGSDTWKLFPVIANPALINTGGAPVSSYPYGLAFRKNA
jgi:hypothetical protein